MTTSEPQAALDPATTTTTINNMAPEQSSPARAFIDRLAATIPSLPTDTNYISLAIGYGRQAVQPAVQQWSSWTAGQRFIALCLLLPVIAGPAMTLAFFAPVIAVTVAAIYVALFGVEVGQLHYKEAIKEHFGVDGQPAISLDAFKKRAEELKVKAEGSQFAQKTMHYGSVAVGQVLFFTVVVLDYIIAVLLLGVYVYMYLYIM